MKKYVFLLLISFFPLFVFADDYDSYDSYGSYDSYDSYDVYDVYDVYDTYDFYDSSLYYSDNSYSTYSSSNSSHTLACPVYNAPSYEEGCSTEWKVDTKGCTYPKRVCKKVEPPKCPTYPRPTYGIGCSIKWNTDTNGCSYMTETCTPVVKPEKNKCVGKHALPTYGKGCSVVWKTDSEGCNYMSETCGSSSKSSNTCAGKYSLPTYAKGCSVIWETDSEGCNYMRETCDGSSSDTKYYNKYGKDTYVPYRYYYDGKWWYVYPENEKNVIKVQGKKKVNTISSCSSTLAPICGKKKIAITDYSSFGTKNIEKYTEITYESECDLEKNKAEYLYPGECRSYSTCPLYKITAKTGCTTEWKLDDEGCEYPVQTCNTTKKKNSKSSTTPRFQGDSNYWFQPVIK